jgi:hypothetical protein
VSSESRLFTEARATVSPSRVRGEGKGRGYASPSFYSVVLLDLLDTLFIMALTFAISFEPCEKKV